MFKRREVVSIQQLGSRFLNHLSLLSYSSPADIRIRDKITSLVDHFNNIRAVLGNIDEQLNYFFTLFVCLTTHI